MKDSLFSDYLFWKYKRTTHRKVVAWIVFSIIIGVKCVSSFFEMLWEEDVIDSAAIGIRNFKTAGSVIGLSTIKSIGKQIAINNFLVAICIGRKIEIAH